MFTKTNTSLLFALFTISTFIGAAGVYADTSTSPMMPATATTSSPANTAPSSDSRGAVVFYLDRSGKAVARVDRLKPMSEGMRAILAMYAFENTTGCDDIDNAGRMHCVLTDALGLGNQCSDEHIRLVSTWFRKGMPNLAGYGSGVFARLTSEGNLGELCTRIPDTSSIQMIWEIIRVRQNGNHIHVEALRDSRRYADGPDYEIPFVTEYLINETDITVLSHKELPMKTRSD